MTTFSAALKALNLDQASAAELLGLSTGTIADVSTGRRGARLRPEGWTKLASLFEIIEQAADEIIANQAELDGGDGLVPLALAISEIPLETRALREAAAARALFVLGPHLLTVIEELG